MNSSESLAGEHQEMLDDGTEGHGGEILQAADDEDDADQQADEQGAFGRERAGEGWAFFLAAMAPAIAITGTT